ncbi:EamA family transporter [Paraflavisolibacter sp. H34]|uniref:DMT family transporter n=1 Tax=Huijunlia imazamoxiresistens TaxID=3127457 RepID=UPI003017A5AD
MKEKWKAYLALAFICVVWGTTYLAVRVGVKDFPPFLFMGMRQTMAGLLLAAFLWLSGKKPAWSWSLFGQQLVPGLCMITFGNGIIGWAVQYIPSGLAALICSMIPLYVILINLVLDRKDRLNWQIGVGTFLGLAGIVLIFRNQLAALQNRQYLAGMIITIISCISWAAGTIYTQKNRKGTDPFLNASVQLFTGGAGILILSLLFEKNTALPPVSASTLFAWIYLVVIGSVAAFAAYLYALSKLPVGLVTVYAYVNPLVAVVLGFLILNEQITLYTVVATVVILFGVYLVNTGFRLKTTSGQ